MAYVDLILPLPLPNTFTYEIPENISDVEKGMRVVVQFGAKKLYTALVYKVHQKAPDKYRAKPILAVLDDYPVVVSSQFSFWEWIADYYCCHLGEVMQAALPSGLKLSSETIIVPGDCDFRPEELTEKEYLIIEALQQQNKLELIEVAKILDQKTIFPIINSLLDRDAIALLEELNDKYKPKIVRTIHLAIKEEQLFEVIKKTQKAPKQLAVLQSYLQQKNKHPEQSVKTADLVRWASATHQVINALVKKGVFIIEEEIIGRIENYKNPIEEEKELSVAQSTAYQSIQNSFKKKDVVLLHGVTSSGKTEIYVKLIKKIIAKGEQVLFLLPEIALTTQIINRLRKCFGDQVGVYHSKFNQNERVEVWNEVLKGNRFPIILGARSAMFLPFTKLGLVIIDEEHETTFKQHHPAPRYNGRDATIVLAKYQGAKVLLGSATPSLESYTNAQNGKYGLVELHERFGGVEMPEVETVDVKYVRHRKRMKGAFSPYLLENIQQALNKGEQIILFQNRRGFAPISECKDCGWTAKCRSCDVSLTYHKKIDLLKCHYCGYSEPPLKKCNFCGSLEVSVKGVGTEKIAEDLQPFFPDVTVHRMDLDTTSRKHAHQEIISAFEDKRIDILIGTQMITKGLDFDNVSVVGILNADSILNFPDFRSFERAYQLMAQVSGRAGRKKKRGKVIIQTYSPDNEIIESVKNNDYSSMFKAEMLERKTFSYPPYCKLIKVTATHRDYQLTNFAARDLAILMRQQFGKHVLGPEYPTVARIKNKFLKHILLKIEGGSSVKQAKKKLQYFIEQLNKNKDYKSVRFVLDIDPI